MPAALAAVALFVLFADPAWASAPRLLTGDTLVLKDRGRPASRRLAVRSRDPGVTLGDAAADPLIHGGQLRIAADGGDGFDTTYSLPADGWRRLMKGGVLRGYRWTGRKPLRAVTVRAGRGITIRFGGDGVAHSLATAPDAVDVVLSLGAQRTCLRFGGTTAFEPGTRFTARDAPAPAACVLNRFPWPAHAVDDRFRGANGLHAADVNRDGFPDYVTNYEFDQRLVIAFHPGVAGNVRGRWPTVVGWQPTPLAQGFGVNPESAALGDVDGDGNVDLLTAQGWSAVPQFEGSEAGVRVVWGPPPAQALDPSAWAAGDAGRIPATIDRGHYLWVRPFDVNGDGATDIVAGGRVHGGNLRLTGPQWIEAPADPLMRRDLSQWIVHDIDPAQIDGHGFVLADVDGDGDTDVVDANADFDTPEEDETVHWYENPGTGSPAQRSPWPKHELYRGAEFDPKPQIAVADLDADGRTDLVTQVERDVYWFRKTAEPATFDRIVVPKDPRARFFSRPIRVADLDRDGRPDLVGALSHRSGDIPYDKASVFWMRSTAPAATAWATQAIRWGSGRTMLLDFAAGFAEKWDQMELIDLDGDGDLDVLANCEEWWENDGQSEVLPFFDPRVSPSSVAVVWFENRLDEMPYLGEERDGTIVMEAEHHTDLGDGSWIERNRFAGHAGDGYMHVHNARAQPQPLAPDATRGLAFQVATRGGTYRLWIRRWVPSVWGYGNGGSRSDSAWIAVDGGAFAALDDAATPMDAWTWVAATAPVTLSGGTHVVTVRAREHGYAIDRILLTRDPAYTPDGIGPAETLAGR